MEQTRDRADEQLVDIISFQLGEQMYCVDIMAVREIRGWTACTPMQGAPDYIMGVINLRGAVIPIVDVAMRIGSRPANPSERSAIIVIDQGDNLFGLLVESVSDMLRVNKSDLQPVPEVIAGGQRSYAKAIISSEKEMICFLDPEPLIGNEVSQLMAAA